MMRILLIISFAFFNLSWTSGGEGETKLKVKDRKTYDLAEYHFASEDYILSEKYYAKLVKNYPKDGYFRMQLGYSLFELDRFEESIRSFEEAIEFKMQEAHYLKARAHHRVEQFEEALEHYVKYLTCTKKTVTDARINKEMNSVKRAIEAYKFPLDVRVKNIGSEINSQFDDYVPLISPDGKTMIFTSKRPGGATNSHTKWESTLFEDIFISNNVHGKWTMPIRMSAPVNSAYHDANVCFSADGASLIIYRNEKFMESGDLYLTENSKNGWSEPEKLPGNVNSAYHEPSACLDPSGQRMYLVSNRPGSFGERDLFLLNKLPNKEWSEPINLGRTINTEYNEDAPFVDPTGKYLYFSSEGHDGIGGFDIYKAKINDDGTLETPVNMGYPINTVQDDIYFSITSNGKKAFFSSLKVGDTYGEQDIYELDLLFEDQDYVIVKGNVQNKKYDPLEAFVKLTDEEGNVVQKVFADPERGNFMASVLPDRKYTITISYEGYETHEELIEPTIKTKGEFSILSLKIILKEEQHE